MSKPQLQMEPMIAIAAGALILFKPKLLNYVVAGYLIFTGVTKLTQSR